ncbi:MAG TPA: DEAD/DEAH box helicase family protein, partial [Candidatus Wunengus californicus]|uniref:DEAD/DEAH box helicase family protein n=1 Tax=Candidatus Wunengus californicus TaxID=3367619 RepID=UPI004029E4EF
MVDFSKRLGKRMAEKPTDPIQIYDTLDRASDKGPLRDVQREILSKWYKEYRSKKDVILKLHTGQGKTLIGLLILQSRLNEKKVPVLYLCPNNFLVNQTCLQASQFGIDYCTAENDLPDKFIDSSAILITSVQKLFNGLTKFHIGTQSISVSALLMDDSHACIDAIRDSLIIRLNKDNP